MINRRHFLTAISLTPLLANDFVQNTKDIYLSYNEYATLEALNSRLKD
ncbi:MAG: D-alanyl-D-alanine carboxypeptidase [Sulfurimonas sp.]|jgi:D-alanyl-D-alanine carboxypeptidase